MLSLRAPYSTSDAVQVNPHDRDNCVDVRRALIVLGMHRSGTSALTRVLGLCGAALPSRSLFDTHESNPRGHWEPRKIVETHEQFLAEAGVSWDDIGDYPAAIFTSGLADLYRERLAAIARREYGQAAIFVVKDPRLSRLIPLWRPVLAKLGAAPRAIIAVRNPLNVAASMQRRDGWDEYRALAVWMRYMLAAERDTRHMPRCFVRHENLVGDWRPLVQTISNRLDVSLAARDETVAAEIDAFVSRDLVHHHSSDRNLFERGNIPDCIKQVYRCFRAAATGEAINTQGLDSISEALGEAAEIYRRNGLDAHWQDAPAHVVDIRRHQLRRDALFALSLAELGKVRNQAQKSQQQLDTVLKSRSWRLTRPFRGASYLVKRLSGLMGNLSVLLPHPH